MKTFYYTIAIAAVAASSLFADEPAKPTAPVTKPAVIQKRKEVQQNRIANGVGKFQTVSAIRSPVAPLLACIGDPKGGDANAGIVDETGSD